MDIQTVAETGFLDCQSQELLPVTMMSVLSSVL